MKLLSLGLVLTLAWPAAARRVKEFSLPRADEIVRTLGGSRPVAAPVGQQIEVGFSPNQGAEEVVLKVINSSTKSLRVAAYPSHRRRWYPRCLPLTSAAWKSPSLSTTGIISSKAAAIAAPARASMRLPPW